MGFNHYLLINCKVAIGDIDLECNKGQQVTRNIVNGE